MVDEGQSFKKIAKRVKNPPVQKRSKIGPSIVKSFANMKLTDEVKSKSRLKVSAAEDKMNEDLMNDIFNDLDEGVRINEEYEKEEAIKEASQKRALGAMDEERTAPRNNGGQKSQNNNGGEMFEGLDTRGFEDLDNMLAQYEVENLDLKPINRHNDQNGHGGMDIEISGPKPKVKLSRRYNPDQKRNLRKLFFSKMRDGQSCQMNFNKGVVVTPTAEPEPELTIEKDEDGDEVEFVKFYWIDMDRVAHSNKLNIYGRMYCTATKKFRSACLTINNNYRNLFFVKKGDCSDNALIENVRQEIITHCNKVGKHLKISALDKKYCFELDLPQGEVKVAKASFPHTINADNIPFESNYYKGVFG